MVAETDRAGNGEIKGEEDGIVSNLLDIVIHLGIYVSMEQATGYIQGEVRQ